MCTSKDINVRRGLLSLIIALAVMSVLAFAGEITEVTVGELHLPMAILRNPNRLPQFVDDACIGASCTRPVVPPPSFVGDVDDICPDEIYLTAIQIKIPKLVSSSKNYAL